MHSVNSDGLLYSVGSKSSTKRLAFADGLRGVAACWVVLFHMSEGGHVDGIKKILPDLLYRVIFSMGDLGVPIFFVLSGYVMSLTTKNLNFDFSVSWRFVARRLARLLPVYYFSIVLVLAILFAKEKVMGSQGASFGVSEMVSHVFLVQGILGVKNIDPVFWTLCIELQFYLAFSVLLFFADRSFWAGRGRYFLFILSALFALVWPAGFVDKGAFQGLFLPYWYCFMAGVWASVARQGAMGARLFSVGYAVVLLGIGLFSGSEAVLVGSLVVFGLMLASGMKKEDVWLSARWIQLLGLVSYSLYLIHNPITGASFNVLRRIYPMGGIVFDLVAGALVVLICVLASLVVYNLVERPSIYASRRIVLSVGEK